MGVTKGMILNYVSHSVTAILSLDKDSLFCPCIEELKEISAHIQQKYKFLHCVGYVDGTHLGLAFKAELHGEENWTRNQQYVISTHVFMDDLKHIRHLQVGWLALCMTTEFGRTLLYASNVMSTSAARNMPLVTWHSTTVQ